MDCESVHLLKLAWELQRKDQLLLRFSSLELFRAVELLAGVGGDELWPLDEILLQPRDDGELGEVNIEPPGVKHLQELFAYIKLFKTL